ncbi:MAG: MaoC family dehydratase N-terminal domain-containing protein [Pseudomonadota bacterium]
MTNITDWIGREQTRVDVINARQAELLAVTLGVEKPVEDQPLPECWHWAWFNDALPVKELGRDGHPKRGGFIPPVALPRRMWAGGSLEFVSPVIIGREIRKVSRIEAIKEREGSTGKLCIVTLAHRLYDGEILCVDERQNLVFREDPKPGAGPAAPIEPPQHPTHTHVINPDPVMMFRYSALTFNGHRIHYDVDYARKVEGYPDLVFHAPLTATSLCSLAGEILGQDKPRTFTYRATAPLFCNAPVKLAGKKSGKQARVWAETPSGSQAMLAEANA